MDVQCMQQLLLLVFYCLHTMEFWVFADNSFVLVRKWGKVPYQT